MRASSLHDLYVEELRDLYNAEKQLVKALPKLAKAAHSEALRSAFEEHLEQTRGHVERLERVFETLDLKPRGRTCEGMIGLIEEGGEVMDLEGDENVRDAGLIAAAQKVEHYEIASYGTLRAWARQLGEQEAANLLEQTLNEESQTDKRLTDLALSMINPEAKAS